MGCSCTQMGGQGSYCTGNTCCPGSAGNSCPCQNCPELGMGWGCFIEGTLITMSDGSKKKIEDLDQDEKILSYNLETEKIEEDIILEIQTPFRDQFVTINCEHGKNKNTFDHPYWSVSKSKWVSYAPGQTEENYELNDVWELEEGEVLLFLDDNGELNQSKVESIVVEDLKSIQTYNLSIVKNNNNFFANGYLVHNKGGSGGGHRVIPGQPKSGGGGNVNEDKRQLCPNGRQMIDGNCEGDYNTYSSSGGNTGIGNPYQPYNPATGGNNTLVEFEVLCTYSDGSQTWDPAPNDSAMAGALTRCLDNGGSAGLTY